MHKFIFVVAALSFLACRNTTGPEIEFGTALIGSFSTEGPPIVVLSDTMRAGVPFAVTVNTLGSDGCWQAERTDVVNSERGAIIAPYNKSNALPGSACTQMIIGIAHRMTLLFATAGEKILQVRARDAATGQPREVGYTLIIRPR